MRSYLDQAKQELLTRIYDILQLQDPTQQSLGTQQQQRLPPRDHSYQLFSIYQLE